MSEVRQRSDTAALCLQFLILTAARLREATEASWDEVADDIWTVPAARMKSGVEHRVPLSRAALDILAQVPCEGRYIFPGNRPDRPIAADGLRKIVKTAAGNEVTIHGFRSAFRDWAAERTNYARELSEAALAHRVSDATERAYQRGDLLEKRRALMDAWARFCAAPLRSEVLPIRAQHG